MITAMRNVRGGEREKECILKKRMGVISTHLGVCVCGWVGVGLGVFKP